MGYLDLYDPEQHYYKFRLEKDSEAFKVLAQALHKWPHLASSNIREEHRYTRKELLNAELLEWWPTTVAAAEGGETYGTPFEKCPKCGPALEQKGELIINKSKIGKKDIASTYEGQIILTEGVARMLEDRELNGFELWPVHHYKRPYNNEPTLYQLMVTHVLPPMASPPTEFKREVLVYERDCPEHGLFVKHHRYCGPIRYRTPGYVYYSRKGLELCDFNRSKEIFGLCWPTPSYIINPRVCRLLVDQKVHNWAVGPVYLVD